MTNAELMNLLAEARRRRILRTVSEETGISYSYVSKLAQGHKSLEELGPVYRQALEQGLERHLADNGSPEARKPTA